MNNLSRGARRCLQTSKDADRFRWIEKHRPYIEYCSSIRGQELSAAWIVSLENGSEIGATLRTALDKAMRKIPLVAG